MGTSEQKFDVATNIKAQAKLRAILGLPIIIGVLVIWGRQEVPDVAVPYIAAVHTCYILLMVFLAFRSRAFSAQQLALGSAVLDPLMLSAWLPALGEAGGLTVGFYLFTILGFGFRIGLRLMTVCQIAAITGFTAVLALEPFWQQQSIIWLSFLIPLVIVPLYARALISKLHEARAHAERESQAKSQLLAKVSHELRTPLSGIVAAAQLLSSENHNRQITKRVGTILSLSKDLLREIDDLLDQAKQEAKALVMESAPFDLGDQMERLRLTLEPASVKKGIGFLTDVDVAIKDRVQGDSHYLNRVLLNLAGNAVKFTENGKVEVSIKLLAEQATHYLVRFSVRDTGIGIPAVLHEQIFEPFFQADDGTTRKYGGTGLGMTIAREIVTLMGGKIRLESEPGKGSLFYFDLTLARTDARQETPTQPDVPVVRGKRVLVADDNDTNLMLIKELLERDRHEVIAVKSGEQALEVLSAREFDVIFLDFNMQDMDGVKVLQIYRFGKLNAAPAFFLTADATATTAIKLRNAGAVGVLNKPIMAERLRQAIAQVSGQQVSSPLVEKVAPVTSVSFKPAQKPLTVVPTQHISYAVIRELQLISDRPQFLGELLGNAVSDIEHNCHDLVQAISARDFSGVRDTAHALKGVCASVGAARLEALAGTLMRAPSAELEQSSERLKADIAEVARISVTALRDIIADRAVTTN